MSGSPKTTNRLPLPVFFSSVRHVQVGVHPRLQDREAAEAAQLGGVGVEVEGAGDQHVKAGVGRFARGGDEVLPADRAVFRANQDRGPAFGPVLALDEGAARHR